MREKPVYALLTGCAALLLLCLAIGPAPALANIDDKAQLFISALNSMGISNAQGQVSINVTPKQLDSGSQTITVAWSGISDAKKTDRVAIYMVTPAGAYYPIGYYPLERIPDWQSGSGVVTLSLYHPRENSFVFTYERDGQILSRSDKLEAKVPELATQVRLALTHDPSEMRVTYTRFNGTTRAELIHDYVLYAPAPFDKSTPLHIVSKPSDPYWRRAGQLDEQNRLIVRQVTSSLDSTYTLQEMCNDPANLTTNFFHPGYFLEATMIDLAPHTTYWYMITSATDRVADSLAEALKNHLNAPKSHAELQAILSSFSTQTYSFESSYFPGPDDEVAFFAFGDLGIGTPYMTKKELQPPAVETMNNMLQDLKELRSLIFNDPRPENCNCTEFKRIPPSMVLHIGDISYARGFAYLWELFMQGIEPIASTIPWMISVGNHEIDWPTMPWHPTWSDMGNDSGGECGWPTYSRFHMPPDYTLPKSPRRVVEPTPTDMQMPTSRMLQLLSLKGDHHQSDRLTPNLALKEPRNIAYSFNFGPIHIALFSGEHDFLPGSAQYAFLEKDLQNVDRKVTPWVIVATHRPMYCSSLGCSLGPDHMNKGVDNVFREAIEPLLLKYQVDLGLWGHVHTYERTCPMAGKFTCAKPGETKGAPVHVVIGMAGNVYNGLWEPYLPNSESKSDRHHVQPEWSIFRSMNFGYARVQANAKKLRLQFVGNHGRLIHDEFVLEK